MNSLFIEETMPSTNDCAFYIATDRTTGNRKLIKVCKNPDRWEEFQKAFEKEYALMKSLSCSHCHTIPVYDGTGHFIHVPYRNAPCIVTEYIEGITLKECLERHWKNRWPRTNTEPAMILSKEALSHICEQVYETICFLYRNNIVYFDLSPSNIIITNDKYDIKFIDFTFCCDRNAPGHYKQYEPDKLITSGRPLPASITRTVLFFFARLFYSSEDSFATLNAKVLSQESCYLRKHFPYTFRYLFEHEDPAQDMLLKDESCFASEIEEQLVLLNIYYERFINHIKDL